MDGLILILIFSSIVAISSIFLHGTRFSIFAPANYVIFFIVIGYVLVPSYIFFSGKPYEMFAFEASEGGFLLYFLSLFIFAFFMMFGYFLCAAFTKNFTFCLMPSLKDGDALRGACFVLVVSLMFFVCYMVSYGGIAFVVENVSAIRSGRAEIKSYFGSLASLLSNGIIFVFLAFFSYWLKNKKYFIFVILIFLFALVKKYLDGGRGGLVSLIIASFWVYCLVAGRVRFMLLIVGLIVAIMVIAVGKGNLFTLFSNGFSYAEIDYEQTFLHEFSYMSASVISAYDNNLVAERLGADFFVWIFLPLKAAGLAMPDSISYLNTYHLLGRWESHMPPGLIAFALMQGGVIFLAVYAFLFGCFCSVINSYIKSAVYFNNISAICLLVFSFLQLPRLVMGMDFSFIVLALLPSFLALVSLYVFRKRSYRLVGESDGH